MGLSSSEDTMILAWVVLTQCQTVSLWRTDGQTQDGRTDRRIYDSLQRLAYSIDSKLCW